MLIYLKNFKIWTEKTFEFQDNVVSLLLGESGTGKSSIVQAIFFAITGSGNKVTTYNQKSCEVILVYNGLKITRSKNPTRLLVEIQDKIYHDESAQVKIDKVFGSNFKTVSYLAQNAAKNFISLSSSDKMNFLESFAGLSHSENTNLLKEKCEKAITEKNQEIISVNSRIDLLQALEQNFEEPEYVKCPFTNETNFVQQVKEISENYSKEEKKLAEAKKLQSTLQNQLQERTLYDFETDELDKNIPVYFECNPDSDLIQLKQLEQNYSYLIKSISLKQEKDFLISRLWKTYTKEETKNVINDYQELLQDCEKADKIKIFLSSFSDKNNLESQITKLKNEIEEIDLKFCPVCQSTLKCNNSSRELVLVHRSITQKSNVSKQSVDTLIVQLERLNKGVEKRDELKMLLQQYLADNLPSVAQVKIDLDEMLTYNFKNKSDEEKISEISEKLKSFPLLFENDPENLKQKIKSLSETIYKNDIASKQYHSYLCKKEDLKRRIPSSRSLPELQEDLKRNSLVISDSENTITNLSKIQRECILYQHYKSALSKYLSMTKEVDNLQSKEKDLSLEYEALITLNAKILEAESISLQKFIDQINVKVQFFINHFFDNEMSVKLKAFKPSKKSGVSEKPQINLEIEFRGEESDVNCLSGGEYSRLVLAFNLAFVQISQCPIVLLDECTSSLDAENTTNVFEKIIDFFPDHLVIAVAHQVIEGQFISVIKI